MTYEEGEIQGLYNNFFNVFDVKQRATIRYKARVVRPDDRLASINLF